MAENSDKRWTTQYDKQKRVDQDSRTKAVTPYHRLVKKGNKPFTTEKSGPDSLRFKPK
jgi:hypothetical protein